MKNYEVGIIIVAIVVIGFLWWKNYNSTQTKNPVNATSQGFRTSLNAFKRSDCGAII